MKRGQQAGPGSAETREARDSGGRFDGKDKKSDQNHNSKVFKITDGVARIAQDEHLCLLIGVYAHGV